MASSTAPGVQLEEDIDPARGEIMALGPTLRTLLLPLASLKVTVFLFALAIFIVLAGTLAQTQHDIWYVVDNYFRTGIAWIDLQVFFPKSFFPNLPPVPGRFPFPGGWLIGGMMAANLFAAHAVRFTYQARGARLMTGLGALAFGVLVTGLVIAGGSGDALQGVPFFEWSTLWALCKLTLAALAIVCAWGAMQLEETQILARRILLLVSGALGVLVGWLFVEGDAVALGDSSMRILWQLIQGTLAGGILLAGCWMVFNKRAGIVLLHGGIGLMMFSELLVGTSAIEGQMHIREGDTVNFVQDIREVELAVVDESGATEDRMIVVPQSLLKAKASLFQANELARKTGADDKKVDELLKDELLPFDVRVVKFLQNANVRMVKEGDENPATAGLGREMFAGEVEASVGASSSSKVDESAVYVEFLKKGTTESLGTYLLSLLQSRIQESHARSGMSDAEIRGSVPPFLLRMTEPTIIEVDGKPYHLALRFKRMYKPYSMKLLDVRTEYYPGTTTPKDYSSTLRLTDAGRDVDRDVKVWMNNPLRFAGETFYQSSVGDDPVTNAETTGLQVVTNSGWMIPYVSCMIVGVGMLYQFGLTLLRFLKRRESGAFTSKEPGRNAPTSVTAIRNSPSLVERALPIAIVLLCAAMILSQARPPKPTPDGFDLYAAGKLPILYQGRAKPLDTLARNTLQVISNKETFVGLMDAATLRKNWSKIESRVKKQWTGMADENLTKLIDDPRPIEALSTLIESKTKADRAEINDILYKVTSARQPAIRWLLDVVSGREVAESHRVFRIDNLEVLDMLGLDRREGFLYSLAEIRQRSEKFNQEVDKVNEKVKQTGMVSLEVYERKLLDLDRRIRSFTAVDATFRRPDFPATPTQGMRDMVKSRQGALKAELNAAEKRLVEKGHPPLVVPVRVAEGGKTKFEWKPYVSAWTRDYFESRILEEHAPDPAVAGWDAILTAYNKGDADEFNRGVRKYQSLMADEAPPDLRTAKTSYEVFFNWFSPFFVAWILYIGAFVVTILAWLLPMGSASLRRSAFWMTVLILALHTFALGSRIYISGRPPVTNLYSSAVFIGWGCVVLGLILERVFRLGIGNAVSTIAGFATLFISFKLAGDGDTFIVMQAVLDTQFWLATHVTCITLGYATTFLSGLLGAFYVLRGVCTPTLNADVGKSLARMIYGTLCFAIYFSFVGTVLGGLWADDSWGRFWGWDPKENGALIIVLWNALVLHARWDGMVKDRGLAVLAIGGNIVTAWSWFGVNELGIGLHSYGFTEGVLLSLGLFVVSQLALIAAGSLPRHLWWSSRRKQTAAA
jgi:ABC-type transport system involved in cytochrome c biogenesis permease subunit